MKKMIAMCAFAASLSAFAAVEDVVLTVSTKGPDTYADGSTVLDGECYALVWQPAGATGALAIAADGSVVDPTQGEIVLTVPTAKNGRCPTIAFQIAASYAAQHEGGTWSLYLLDTRTSAADGTVSLAGVANGRAKAVNAASAVAGATVQATAASATLGAAAPQTLAASGAATAATVSAIPADAPQPTVKDIRVDGGYVYVTVADTAPYLQYNLTAGTDPANLNEAKAAENPVNGKSGEDIILVTPAKAGGAFFRVGRN